MKVLLSISLIGLFSATAVSQWIKQPVDTTASLRGLSVVNEKVIWASGTGGTVIRTTDAGNTWKVMTVPGAEKLDFRDIEAFDENTAYVLSIGNGDSSRIYKTTDGGDTWWPEFKNTDERAFFDAIACWDREYCITISDPVDNKFVLLRRSPGRRNNIGIRAPRWAPTIYRTGIPAKEGEAAFAASGTCLITQGESSVFLVTGGSDARVFRSEDRGITWLVADTPIVKGTSGSGIFSIAMRDARNGVIVGGNYEKPNETSSNLALTSDGGRSWISAAGLTGYRSGVTYVGESTIVAVGTSGSDISRDGGKTWKKLGDENLNAVQAKGERAVWAVGPKGLVVKLKN